MNKNTLAFQSWRGKTSHSESFEDIPWNLSMNNPGSMTLKRSFSLSSVFSFLSWGKREAIDTYYKCTVCQALCHMLAMDFF